jgi:hypothetical protein
MGQYYRGVVLGKTSKKKSKFIVRQAFCCYAHHTGAKLTEHSYVGVWYIKEYEKALAEEFHGYPFVWIGDYADTKFDVDGYTAANEFIDKETHKNAISQGYTKNVNGGWGAEYIRNGETAFEKDFAVKTPLKDFIEYKYIVNYTKKQYIRIPDKKGEIHPLPLLCADGNGRGGGDYEGVNMQLVGSWAYDEIGVTNTIPENIKTELVATFRETYKGGDSSVNDFILINKE